MTVDVPDQHQMTMPGPEGLCVELIPPTLHDSLAAVLYEVARPPFDPLDITEPFTMAMREAMTRRMILRQRSVRRRYVAAIVRERTEALTLPPHLRPGLVLALQMSHFMAGGVLIEDMNSLGANPVHRAATIGWLAERAGVLFADPKLPELPDPRLALEPVGTFTIGYLGAGGRYVDVQLLHEAVTEWNRDAQNVVPIDERDREQATAEMLADAVIAHTWKPADMSFFAPTTTSAVVGDLSIDAAAAMVRSLRDRQSSTTRVVETLQLLGYHNPSGHRVWNRDILAEVERG